MMVTKLDEKKVIPPISDVLATIFKSYNVRKAVLFGSYGKGTPQPDSDLDILVDSGLKGLEFVELIEDARNAVQRDVDLFDVRHVEKGSLLYKEIQNTGVVIYEA
jgi:predicted nucleotidyltransferase